VPVQLGLVNRHKRQHARQALRASKRSAIHSVPASNLTTKPSSSIFNERFYLISTGFHQSTGVKGKLSNASIHAGSTPCATHPRPSRSSQESFQRQEDPVVVTDGERTTQPHFLERMISEARRPSGDHTIGLLGQENKNGKPSAPAKPSSQISGGLRRAWPSSRKTSMTCKTSASRFTHDIRNQLPIMAYYHTNIRDDGSLSERPSGSSFPARRATTRRPQRNGLRTPAEKLPPPGN